VHDFHMQCATHAGILSSHLSTTLSSMASLMWERSPTHSVVVRNQMSEVRIQPRRLISDF
jgi:hypothetical protein